MSNTHKRDLSAYLKQGRISDVLALIQVLAFDEASHRSEAGFHTELQGSPLSADSWTDVAREHPEFFRVYPTDGCAVSLIARHVGPMVGARRQVLPADFARQLMDMALEIHDRQVKRDEKWTVYLPVIASSLAAGIALIGVILQVCFKVK